MVQRPNRSYDGRAKPRRGEIVGGGLRSESLSYAANARSGDRLGLKISKFELKQTESRNAGLEPYSLALDRRTFMADRRKSA